MQQTIEIKIAGPDNTAFAQIIAGTKRSAQKRYASLTEAMHASEEIVAKYGAVINWQPFDSDMSKQIGTYEIGVNR